VIVVVNLSSENRPRGTGGLRRAAHIRRYSGLTLDLPASFVPLLQVGSETVHFPNESPAKLKQQCLATLEMSAADRRRLNCGA
jgi:hypothetical protein